ncbi:hypothetical protein SAMD00019534_005070 [Acytostelium subglobosum LB1]|uniref:hypothetical protein n=1 Tax=Acytostelium subglobosum LB1 TaxID=1410327 RepID=UPI000644FABA|nr:hypothetical protein SAMD00019534_005070 [Acytostelium subglobosum LB1]GAM17332.1 hypothetical protein SAMD00019534_005070 [Acytostelium subglobosum LB1]|eukprot:XP_012759394.1 hypothetical protein SAMD00019534_005070 [Acytostelium subglobosum LB1]
MLGIRSLLSAPTRLSSTSMLGNGSLITNSRGIINLYNLSNPTSSRFITSSTQINNNNNSNNNSNNNNKYNITLNGRKSFSTAAAAPAPAVNNNIEKTVSEHFEHNAILTPGATFTVPVISLTTKHSVDNVVLLKSIFNTPLRVDLLHRVVRWQRAKAMQGTHYAQNMGDIDRTNKKPMSQKGNGRARQGTNHAIQMRGGARAFPPKPRDHSFSLPKKVRALALKVALSTKLAQNKLVIVDSLQLGSHRTKELEALLPEVWGRSLLVDSDIAANLSLAAFNLKHIDLLPQRGINVYSILQKDTLVLTKEAVELIQKRLSE